MSSNQIRKVDRATSSSSNGSHHHASTSTSTTSNHLQSAIALADIYHGRGTTYLHIDNPLLTSSTASSSSSHSGNDSLANPTGAVVPAISLATTFKQSTPGEPTARDDPNSFGMGYEYSRTGMWYRFIAIYRDFVYVLFVISIMIHIIPLSNNRKSDERCVWTCGCSRREGEILVR